VGCALALALLCAPSAERLAAQNSAAVNDALNIDLMQPWLGRVVSSIKITGLSDAPQNEALLSSLSIRVGQPLEREAVRLSLRQLYASGLFSRLQLEAKAGDNGLELNFVVEENYFVGPITIEGRPRSAPNEQQLSNAANLSLGVIYTRRKAEAGAESIARLMGDFGFRQCTVTFIERPEPLTRQMSIVYRLEPGAIARIGRISSTGDAQLDDKRLRHVSGLKSGAPAYSQLGSRAVERLRKLYRGEKRLEAQVKLERTYDAAANRLDYAFRITPGPIVQLSVEGMSIGRSALRRAVPIYEENAVDEDLLNEGKRNLRDLLQTRGYFDANVEFEQKESSAGHVQILYHVQQEEKNRVRNVRMIGEKYLHEADLRPLLACQPAGMMYPHGRYSQSLMQQDVETLRAAYEANGFDQAKVTAEARRGQTERDLEIVYHIVEGQQMRVGKLTIEGVDAAAVDRLRAEALSMTEGQPFSRTAAGADRDAVLSYYYNHGYPFVQVESAATPDASNAQRMNLSYQVREGQRVTIRRVIVTGVEHTHMHVIDREVDLHAGAPLSHSAMIAAQSRLYDLGILNSVDVAVQNPDGRAPSKNVLYNLQEARRTTINYGFGFEAGSGVDVGQGSGAQAQSGVSPRLSLDVTRLNIRGKDQSITLKSRYGRFVKRAQLSYESPHWFDLKHWRLSLGLFYDDSRDVNTFASRRVEGSAQIINELSRGDKLMYGFSYRRVKVDPSSFPAGFDPTLKLIYTQPVRVGMPGMTYVRDHRDDPLNSTKGSYLTVDAGIAAGAFASEASYARLLGQYTSYHSFGRHHTWVLARSTRIGSEQTYQHSTVPLPEHFFSGGGNTLRGFSVNQAGPRDMATGGPLGGTAIFVNNIELRLPPAPLPFAQNNLSLVLFHDMGNVFDNSHDMFHSLLRWKQRDPLSCHDLSATGTCNFNFVSHAVGGGLRYHTPIGPVRIDVGYNLNPADFPIKQAQGSTAAHWETMRRFNFFFSIGQTF